MPSKSTEDITLQSSMESRHLPSCIIYDILIRVCSQTLGRCRLVCKEWNQITYESSFMKAHSKKANKLDGFFFEDSLHYLPPRLLHFSSINDDKPDVSIDFLPGYHLIHLASSKNCGITLCKSYIPSIPIPCYYVCKPGIRLYQQIPNRKTKFRIVRVAIMVLRSNPLRFKILILSGFNSILVDGPYCFMACEVFDSETWRWERLKDVELESNIFPMDLVHAASVCGSFHWLVVPGVIFAFDIVKEEWMMFPLPTPPADYHFVKLAEYEEKLALICVDHDKAIHIWVMENYTDRVWKKKFSLGVVKHDRVSFTPFAFYGSDIVVGDARSLKYYDFKNGRFVEPNNRYNWTVTEAFPFWSDYEPFYWKNNFNVESKKKDQIFFE